MKICANGVCDIGIVEQYKICYPCHFIFSSELDMFVLSTSFKFGRLSSILLKLKKNLKLLYIFLKKLI